MYTFYIEGYGYVILLCENFDYVIEQLVGIEENKIFQKFVPQNIKLLHIIFEVWLQYIKICYDEVL